MTVLTRLAVLPVVVLGAAAVGGLLQLLWGLSDGMRSRSNQTARRCVVLALLLLGVGSCGGYLARNLLLRQYDAIRLARFAHRIVEADHIVATWADSSIRLPLAGEDAQKVVRAVSTAVSARLPRAEFACAYSAKATFYKGTNVLGQIRMCNSLFLLEFSQPPFLEDSGVLDTLIYTPTLEALRASYAGSSERR